LLDLFLLYYVDLIIIIILGGYELSLFIGLLLGLRGQGRFKQIMLNLEGIARNKKLSIDEREHKLVMGVHHHFLELGYLYEERNKQYGLDFTKKNKKKKTKNKRGVIMKEEFIKELLYWFAGIWLGFLPIVYDLLWVLELRPLIILGILIMLATGDALFFAYIKIYWGIEKEDVKPVPPPIITVNYSGTDTAVDPFQEPE